VSRTTKTRIELERTDDELALLIDEFAAHCALYGATELTVIGDDGLPVDLAPLLPPGFAVRAGRIVTD
jgi:hypothetical protein